MRPHELDIFGERVAIICEAMEEHGRTDGETIHLREFMSNELYQLTLIHEVSHILIGRFYSEDSEEDVWLTEEQACTIADTALWVLLQNGVVSM